MSVYAIEHSPIFSGGYHKFSGPYLRPLPVRRIDFAMRDEVRLHDRIAELAKHVAMMRSRMQTPKQGHDQVAVRRQIDAMDNEIDDLVYEAYGLTDSDVSVVREETAIAQEDADEERQGLEQ
jgi:hypothetical protein